MRVTKSEGDGNHPASHYLIVEDPEHPSTWHLRVRGPDGKPDHRLMGAAQAALTKGYRGNKYEGPNKAEALAKLRALYKSEGLDWPSEANSDVGAGTPAGPSEICAMRLTLGEPVTGQVAHGGELHEHVVCVPGTWFKSGKRFSISAQDLADIARNFEKRKNDQVVIDYEHASEQPEVARGGPVPAAGWIHQLVTRDSESVNRTGTNHEPRTTVLAAVVEWTPPAKQMIELGQYRFFSPAIDWSAKDKETGEPQGATLTSGALTNHPFLEELPALALSENGAVLLEQMGQAQGPAPAAAEWLSDLLKEKTMAKKLSIKCSADGKHQVFDGEDMVGEMDDGEMRQYAARHLGVNPGPNPGMQNKMTETFSEFKLDAGKPAESFGQLVEFARKGRAAEATAAATGEAEKAAAARKLVLSECFKPANTAIPGAVTFSDARAIKLMREGKITGIDYAEANQAEKLLDRAVRELKILPRDRAFYLRDAIERPAEFATFIDQAAPVIRLGGTGIGSAEQVPVDEEVTRGVKKLMSEHEAARKEGEPKLTYGQAMKQFFRENAGVEDRYRAAHRRVPKDGSEPQAETVQ